jgi:hypothetical protein
VIEAGKAKTAARRLVPISDNLAAWLTPHVKRFGPVNPCTEEMHNVGNALGNRFERAAARAKVFVETQWLPSLLHHLSRGHAQRRSCRGARMRQLAKRDFLELPAHSRPKRKAKRGSRSCR